MSLQYLLVRPHEPMATDFAFLSGAHFCFSNAIHSHQRPPVSKEEGACTPLPRMEKRVWKLPSGGSDLGVLLVDPPYWAPHARAPGALLHSSCSRLPWGSGVSQFPAQEGAVVLLAVAAPASSLISPMFHSCFSLVLKRPIAGAILSTKKDICAAGSSHHSPLRIQL